MKTQYLAQVQNGYCKKDEWWNAKMMCSTKGRYCESLDEAQMWINKAIEQSTKKHVIGTPPFSIESMPTDKDIIINTRIRKRQVTNWEEI